MKRSKGNPVIQAVAQAKLRSALNDQKIALYLATKGEDCRELLEGIYQSLFVVGVAYELQHPADTPDVRILRGGISACSAMIQGGYDPINTVAIVTALDAAARLNKHVQPEACRAIWLRTFATGKATT